MVKKLCFILCLTTRCFVVFTQPPAKHWEGIAYNESTNELAVFSGAELNNNKWSVSDSLWLFNGKWRFVDGNNIGGRWAHGLVYHDNALYTYGGLTYNAQQQEVVVNDLLRFKDSWSKVTEGPKLSLPVLFSLRGKLLLAGQLHDNLKSFEVWELTGSNFQKRSAIDLRAERHGLRTLLVKNEFVVVYPSDSGLVFQNVNTGDKTLVNDLPSRTKFGITYSENLDSYFLFGGMDEKRNFSNDLWRIKNGRSEKLVGGNPPSPRASCSLVPTHNGFILFGGVENAGKLSNAMWRYENGKWIHIEY